MNAPSLLISENGNFSLVLSNQLEAKPSNYFPLNNHKTEIQTGSNLIYRLETRTFFLPPHQDKAVLKEDCLELLKGEEVIIDEVFWGKKDPEKNKYSVVHKNNNEQTKYIVPRHLLRFNPEN